MTSNNNIDLFIAGDFCLQDRARKLLAEGSRDKLLNMSAFREMDYRIINLEGAFIDNGRKTVKSGPSLQNPESSVSDLEYYGFNLLCLANNHLMDFGEEGLIKTLQIASAHKLPVVGAGLSRQEAAKAFIISKPGFKLAILNVAENEFGGATATGAGFNGYDAVQAFYDLAALKKQVDKVLVIFHGGHEHYPYPSPEIQKRYRFLIDAGADVVIAHHTHVYSGYEHYNNGFIAYSLGNFIFDKAGKRNDGWNTGTAIHLSFSKDKELEFELHPYSQCNEQPEVVFLKDEAKQSFLRDVRAINEVIGNEKELQKKWSGFLEKAGKKYLTYLEVPDNRYIRGARYYRLLPGWLTRHHRALMLNIVRCESHAEIVKEALSKSISK